VPVTIAVIVAEAPIGITVVTGKVFCSGVLDQKLGVGEYSISVNVAPLAAVIYSRQPTAPFAAVQPAGLVTVIEFVDPLVAPVVTVAPAAVSTDIVVSPPLGSTQAAARVYALDAGIVPPVVAVVMQPPPFVAQVAATVVSAVGAEITVFVVTLKFG